MAFTARSAFDAFEGKIALTPAQQAEVRTRAAHVRTVLEQAFPSTDATPLKTTRLIGSAERGTIVRPLDDLDVLAVFTNQNQVFEKYRYDSQPFLYRVRQRINTRTQVQNVGARGQAVRLFYTDGLHVDIAPVFEWNSGGYALPAGDGSWVTTDPISQAKWSSDRETALNGHFRALVRLAKRWNNVHSHRLASFHVEVMVGNVFGSLGPDRADALCKFFEWGQNSLHVVDPAGHGGDLAGNLSWTQERDINTALESARERAARALSAERTGNHQEAIRLWRLILGNEFPTYG